MSLDCIADRRDAGCIGRWVQEIEASVAGVMVVKKVVFPSPSFCNSSSSRSLLSCSFCFWMFPSFSFFSFSYLSLIAFTCSACLQSCLCASSLDWAQSVSLSRRVIVAAES